MVRPEPPLPPSPLSQIAGAAMCTNVNPNPGDDDLFILLSHADTHLTCPSLRPLGIRIPHAHPATATKSKAGLINLRLF